MSDETMTPEQGSGNLTVREAAVITGFPTDYKFCGSHTSRCVQVGNAVPVHLSYHIAESIKQMLE